MAVATEHLYDSCTCDGGMRDGARCADCGGRGIVIKGTRITGKALEAPEPPDESDLESLTVVQLRARAKGLGLAAGGSKADLIERIQEALPDEEDESEDAGEDAANTASSEATP